MKATIQANIRNFSVVAHIDHGKSTLSDRLIQETGGLTAREMSAQVLDSMDLEKERGITIKAQTVRLSYHADDGETYTLNLIDTPGHVDFALRGQSRVTRRPARACLLLVDASAGRAGSNRRERRIMAIEAGPSKLFPCINKVDLPAADAERYQALADRGRSSAWTPDRMPSSPRPRPASASTMCFRGHRHPPSPAQGRRGRPVEGAAGRRLVRRATSASWCWCGCSTARSSARPAGAPDERRRRTYTVDRLGVFRAQADRQPSSARPARSASSPAQIKDVRGRRRRRHHHRRAPPVPKVPCPASSPCSRWSSAASSRSTPPKFEESARTRSGACASTTPRSPSRWKPAPPWASASAADS